MALGALAALLVSLVAGWRWNEAVSYTKWRQADQVVAAGRRGEYFLGEKGGRASGAVQSYEAASARTMAVVWGLFLLASAGFALERVVRREWVLGAGSWGFAAVSAFMALITLSWAAVTFT
jgi:hypothetical protein